MKDKGSKLMCNDIYRIISEKDRSNIIANIVSGGYDVFVSIQFPINKRTNNLDLANSKLKALLAQFFRIACGKAWIKHNLEFIAVAEYSKDLNFHYHLVMKTNAFNDVKKIQDCFDVVAKNNLFDPYCIKTLPINDGELNKVADYIIKGIKYEENLKRITTKDILFN